MRIEVIVAHYNGSSYIGDQLDSIIKNRLPEGAELRVRVIDDGSRPAEWSKLLTTVSSWPNVEAVQNPQNLGVIRTFERGLKESTGDYVMLCDQDDVWLPFKIESTLGKMREIEDRGAAMVFTNLRTVDRELNTISERMLTLNDFQSERQKHPLLFQNIVTGCTIMLNRALLEFALPFPASVPMHDHWLAICAAFAGKLGFVSEPTMLYRQHGANLVGQPRRTLSARLKSPFKTAHIFVTGLEKKANQARALSARLSGASDKAFLESVAGAFTDRSLAHLNFLVRSRVFNESGISLPFLCALYLFAPKGKS